MINRRNLIKKGFLELEYHYHGSCWIYFNNKRLTHFYSSDQKKIDDFVDEFNKRYKTDFFKINN